MNLTAFVWKDLVAYQLNRLCFAEGFAIYMHRYIHLVMCITCHVLYVFTGHSFTMMRGIVTALVFGVVWIIQGNI